MGVGVAERAEAIIVLLSSSIPQRQLDVLSIHLDIGHIVLEHGGDVNLTGNISDGIPKLEYHGRSPQNARCMHAPRPLVQTWTHLRECSFREDNQQTGLDSGAPPKVRQHTRLGIQNSTTASGPGRDSE